MVDDLLKGCVRFLQSLHGLLEAALHLGYLLPVVADVTFASVAYLLSPPDEHDDDNDAGNIDENDDDGSIDENDDEIDENVHYDGD